MHYLRPIKCSLIKTARLKRTARLSQVTSLKRSAEGDLVPAVTKTISSLLRRKYFMTRLSSQFARRGAQRLSRGNQHARARASWAILVIASLLSVFSPGPARATFSTITQITSTSASVNGSPSISSDGSRVAFRSSSDLTGGNADGNTEIFLCDPASLAFTQVTNSTRGFTFGASINHDG